ncbi:MAG: ThuA domain-containing protein [Verrucomicrobiota bacterium]
MKKLLLLVLTAASLTAFGADQKIVFLAGKPSHGPGEHEHRAGCLLLKACLDGVPGVTSVVYTNGWPADDQAFDGASAIVVYCDGGPNHPLLQGDHLKTLGTLMDKGVGLTCLHYGVEPTLAKGQPEFLEWIGGAFEINWSVNPHWTAEFKSFPEHPIARGVRPFKLGDEWYFHLRFRDGMKGISPILAAVPGESTMKRNDGPHEGNPAVRESVARGDQQVVAWAAERANGGRGFGFTGGHFHKNWADDNFRKVVLNGILWTAHVEIPAGGVASVVTPEQLQANLDPKPSRK